MKAISDRALGWLSLAGFILSAILLLAVWLQSAIAQAKQVGLDRARTSLSTALDDLCSTGGDVFDLKSGKPHGRFYDGILISTCSKTVIVDGKSYQLALATARWDFAGYKYDWLAVTTNHDFIWMDYQHGPKLIPPDYKVSRWRKGY